MNDSDVTPIDRPLMRSDLDAVRRAIHEIQQFQINVYEESKAARREPRILVAMCCLCALVCVVSTVVNLRAAEVVRRAQASAVMR